MSEDLAQSVPEQGVDVTHNQDQGSIQIPNVVPSSDNNVQANTSLNLNDIVPEPYKEKPYMQKIKDVDGLFKAFDNAQTLIGKRGLQVPGEGSSESEWNDFYNAIGRPSDASGYQVNMPDNLPKELVADQAELDGFKGIAHKLGLTQKQVEGLVQFDIERQTQAYQQMNNKVSSTQSELDAEFEQLAQKTFGSNRDAVLDNAGKLISKFAPKEFADDIRSLDNKSLTILASVLDGVTREYINEDDTRGGGSNISGQQAQDLLAEAHEIMKSEAFRNPFDVGHDAAHRKVRENYQRAYPDGK